MAISDDINELRIRCIKLCNSQLKESDQSHRPELSQNNSSASLPEVIVIGAGGHGKVIADIIIKSGAELRGFLDDGKPEGSEVLGHPVLGGLADIEKYALQGCQFVIAIGNNSVRQKIAEAHDVVYYTAIHPDSVIGLDVNIGAGTVVMAGAVINTGAKIGAHCIVNTSSVIEHDNVLDDYVHICPRVALAGTVTVGQGTQIGVGGAVCNNVTIGANCLFGAGAVVVRDIDEPGVYVGVPARWLREL